ncbi:hypothetical protein V5799_028143 [Amblyomma americanum]|uniref:Secreted protein n=1 Tax=Amblyomma americanum TaxID=6943 RepID=A0AAQ4DDP1_AMBAM
MTVFIKISFSAITMMLCPVLLAIPQKKKTKCKLFVCTFSQANLVACRCCMRMCKEPYMCSGLSVFQAC